ncbi:hypothetical protein [Aliicoccus persicus]|uniref:Asparagine synthase n=1 Tax=Aliicoccus persicus TaxID=930138 RepID=A0A662Z004_9STAP|nr:hypothetical protein [Aliicoccus persicus]SEV79774.1 hypothetical protein SAMN05192557_0023 [Aliicoccus persicus]
MEVAGLNYKSAYVITKLNLDNNITNYQKIEIGEMNLYYDDHLDITSYTGENAKIYLLGFCYDIRDGLRNEESILKELLESSDIHQDLEFIGGRYILIFDIGSNQFVYSDALQVRPLVYHTESSSLSSHDTLLANLLSSKGFVINGPSKFKNNSLDFTQYDQIKKYNPSLYTDFKNFKFIRFYPRVQLETKSVEEVFVEIKPFLDENIKYLENHKREVYVTVTGGIDSRVSTSLTRDFSNKIEYLTYTRPRDTLKTPLQKLIYKNDAAITLQMKKYMGWNHTIIDLEEYKPNKSEYETFLKMFNSRHSYSLIKYYREKKKYYKALHFKSAAFGLGKADFSRKLDNQEDSYEFYEKCMHGMSSEFKERADYQQQIREYFDRNKITEGLTLGRHFYDLFYLESRIGNWHSNLTLESDPETDEFILINARRIIDLIMSPSKEDRRQYKLYKKIINNYWPVLLKFDVNKFPSNSKYELDYNNRHTLKNISIISLNQILIEDHSNGVIVKPRTDQIQDFEFYTFSVLNNSNVNKKIKIYSYYRKTKARNNIKVLIKQNMEVKTFDILYLNEGHELEIEGKSNLTISIFYSRSFSKSSWITAGRLRIEES